MSQLLTGFDALPAALAETYLAFLRAQPEIGAKVDELLNAFSAIEPDATGPQSSVRSLVENDRFALLTRQIITLWYSASYSKDEKTTVIVEADPYFQTLLWPAVSAHTPGLFGGYFGYWAYPPEN